MCLRQLDGVGRGLDGARMQDVGLMRLELRALTA
jgi:hypothetical protein